MAAKLDVAGRLAEATAAVDNTQNYVSACSELDYHHPDLTAHPAQIRDWFGSEDGLDLRVLDADCAALRAVAVTADEAARRQQAQLGRLATAWGGAGSQSAAAFVQRHCDAAESLAAVVHDAAEVLAALRDNLWQMIDGKAAAVTAIDDRRLAERAAWLAAAQTVTTGLGDRATASELVDQQVKPFVDNDIRMDWLTAVRATVAAIANSYEAAIAELTAAPPFHFDMPGNLAPEFDSEEHPPERVRRAIETTDMAASPADIPASRAGAEPSTSPAYAAPAAPSAPITAPAPPTVPAEGLQTPAGPVAPASAPAVPSTGLGNFGGLGQWLAESLGGLLPPLDKGLPEMADVDDEQDLLGEDDGEAPGNDEDEKPGDEDAEKPGGEEDEEEDDDVSDEGSSEEQAVAGADQTIPDDECPVPVAAEPVPAESPPGQTSGAPLQASPDAPPPPARPEETPCEIAAAELPRVGQ